MASIAKHFDVSIKVQAPFTTKSITSTDNKRIHETTELKYQSPKNIEVTSNLLFEEAPVEVTATDRVMQSKERFKTLIDDFNELKQLAENRSKNFTYNYDILNLEQENIANAEREIFGDATGSISFGRYQDLLDFEVLLNKVIKEKTIQNGGAFNAVA